MERGGSTARIREADKKSTVPRWIQRKGIANKEVH